jgi:hypothetical protein
VLIDTSAQAPSATTVATAVPAPDMPPTAVAVDVANEADALIDATSPDAASYVFAEDYCRTGPVYPPGTLIVLPRTIVLSPAPDVWSLPESSVNGTALSYANLPYRPFLPLPARGIFAGTVVEIIGPYVENGVCDLWPVRYRTGDGVEHEAYVNEWDLAPEFPNQAPPLPPERESITREMEAFCLSDPDFNEGAVLILAPDALLFSYRRGYGFEFVQTIPAGAEIEITGPPIETGVCDMWRVTASWPNPDYIPPSEPSSEPPSEPPTLGSGPPITWDDIDEEITVGGYIFEPDLRPEDR